MLKIILITVTLFCVVLLVSGGGMISKTLNGLYQVQHNDKTPQINTYNVSNCILARFGAYYKTPDGKYIHLENGVVNSEMSDCGVIHYQPPIMYIQYSQGTLVLTFGSSRSFPSYIDKICGSYIIEGKEVSFFANQALYFQYFSTSRPETYYRCDVEKNVTNLLTNQYLVFEELSYEIYRTSADLDFYKKPEICSHDE